MKGIMFYDDSTGKEFFWPDCIVPYCKNQCCLSLDSNKCYPHTLGLDPEFLEKLKQQNIIEEYER